MLGSEKACKGFADFFVLFLHIFNETICAVVAERRSSFEQL